KGTGVGSGFFRAVPSKLKSHFGGRTELQSRRSAATIEGVEKDVARVRVALAPGAMVVPTLSAPREKFWGMILALTPEGLSLSGIELAFFEDLVVMVRDGEPVRAAAVFFP